MVTGGKIWRKTVSRSTVSNLFHLPALAGLAVTAGLAFPPGEALAKSSTPPPASPSCTVDNGPSNCSISTSSSSVSTTYNATINSTNNLVIVTANNGQSSATAETTSYNFTATISGTGPADSGYGTLLGFSGYGGTPDDNYPSAPDEYNDQQDTFVDGPAVTVNDSAVITSNNADGYAAGSGLNTGGVLLAASYGAPGFDDTNTSPDHQVAFNNFSGGAGGNVTIDMTGSITANGGGSNNSKSGEFLPPTLSGIGAFSLGGVGQGDKNNDVDYAGGGGAGGNITVTNSGTISMSNVNGTPTYGIYAVSEGGEGSSEKNYASDSSGNGGSVTINNSGSITDNAEDGIGINAESIGGQSDDTTVHNNDDANDAGAGGAVNVTLNKGGTIVMTGSGTSNVIGVEALSAGGNSGGVNNPSGGPVTVTLDSGSSITTTGTNLSIGVLAISSGSIGAVQPNAQTIDSTAAPGSPGAVEVSNGGQITTSGAMAVGIAALSIGGSAIVTGAPGSGGVLGNTDSYNGINANNVTVTNTGTIVTDGAASFGIAGISVGGGGGLLNGVDGSGYVSVGSQTGSSGSGESNGAEVQITNSGTITTGDSQNGGIGAIGIVAQSVGGGGGSSSAPAVLVGGKDTSGKGGGNGGTTDVTTNAGSSITTYDDDAIGILAQSIGGGGGEGAKADGLIVAAGGQGGNGGTGGTVNVTLNSGDSDDTFLRTAGYFAAGVVAQSIGGGGGNGGSADVYSPFVGVSIGGQGGNGGAGGSINVTNSEAITTLGDQSFGIVAQSVGGGGGSGGNASTYSVSAISIAVAVGGGAGDGGNGGSVSVTNNNDIDTGCPLTGCSNGNTGSSTIADNGADSIGILAQSVGGGGGDGGAATAKSLSVPTGGEVPISISASFAVGGEGGSGGSGNTVTADNTGQVVTGGDGAYGLEAQSIGGGGGNGGDSTAAAFALEGSAPTVKITLAIGGSGGSGGSGGTVSAGSGGGSSAPEGIYTFGQDATGILAQSIGGGGGTGSAGNASASSPNLGGDTGDAFGLTSGVGGTGGSGGSGGSVTVTNDAGSSVVTLGSGSQGILAQSIGGGGGAAGGGSAAASGDNLDVNVSVGGNGGSGNDGGAVTVTNNGEIFTGGLVKTSTGNVTTGGDGIGILAQSIGGGGGLAGTSDAAASINTAGQIEDALNPPANSYEANIGVGGKGGSGDNGGNVQVTNTGGIQTLGLRAYGIEAQSIGGGGGNGGAATSTSNSVLGSAADPSGKGGTYSADVSVGGTGGAGGNGGSVTVTDNGGSILTAGYGADAILAQAIGGGGGVGAEGTVDNTTSIGLGVGDAGSSGGAGTGGEATVSTQAGGSIVTLGDDAVGILAQSIGGGGGTASAGCTNSAAAGWQGVSATACLGNTNDSITANSAPWNDASDLSLNIGGASGTSGGALDADVTVANAIVTQGEGAMGVVAQSIGGGGGFVEAAAQNISGTSIADTADLGTGSLVNVTLASTGSITTSGAGAWGILAQSIGGGGGFDGDPALIMAMPESNTLAENGSGNAFGNTVTVDVDGNITTSGKNADGIVAQSIGGGGGIVSGCCNSTTANVLAGDNAQFRGKTNSNWGSGTAVEITQAASSTIKTSGLYSTAIFAQSSGDNTNENPINIDISGTVVGGTNGGTTLPDSELGATGIFLSGGISEGGTPGLAGETSTNTVTIEQGGSVSTMDGIAGTAIEATDDVTVLTNDGTITGNVLLGSGTASTATVYSTMVNNGVFNSGPSVVAKTLTNNGTLNVGGIGAVGQTSLNGDFSQSSSGALGVTIDSLQSQVSTLSVQDTATIAGTVVPTAITLLPGTVTVASADSLTSTATTPSSLFFNWSVVASGNNLTISPSANFTPAGATLTAFEKSQAQYFQNAWNNKDAALAADFALLANIPAGGGKAALSAFESRNPQATQNGITALETSEGSILGASMSCPVYEDATTLLTEGSCVWAKAGGQSSNQYASNGEPGSTTTGTTYRLGAQEAIAPGWFLGGSVAGGTTWSSQGASSSNGQVYDGSLALKHQMGQWLFAGSFALASGSYRNNRLTDRPGVGALRSDSTAFMMGGRLRAAYDFPFTRWYVRPYADLDVLNINTPSFQENGTTGYALNVHSADTTNVVVSPEVELGGRLNFGTTPLILRYYADGGVSFMPGSGRTVQVSLAGALAADGTFSSRSNVPNVLGDMGVGLQLYQANGFEVKADYDTQIGSAFFGQAGTLRLAYHF